MGTGAEAALIAGLVASAAGTGTSIYAASKARDDQDAAIRGQLNKLRAMQEQAKPIADKSLEESSPDRFAQFQREGEAQARQAYDRLPSINGSQAMSPAARADVQTFRETASRGEGLNNAALQQWLKNANANQELSVISNLAQSTANNTGVLASLAGSQSAGLSGLGSLMSTLGSLGMMYGASNVGKTGAIKGGVPYNGMPNYSPGGTTSNFGRV